MKELGKCPTMVIGSCLSRTVTYILIPPGADVSHPGPGSYMPSVAALVSSYDPRASQYSATIRVQEARLEVIEDMQSMVTVSAVTSITMRSRSKHPAGSLESISIQERGDTADADFLLP